MTGYGLHFFTDRVVRVGEPTGGRVLVSLRRESATLWVHPTSQDLVDRLGDAAESGDEVLIAWHPGSLEILDVR